MVRHRQAGFTLIEIMIVLAITSLLALVAFIGQRGLREQASFDAAVDKLVNTISDASDQATSGVNAVGGGTGVGSCPGGPAGQYVFAGVAWTADDSLNASAGSPIELQYYEALPGSTACIFQTQAVSFSSGLTVSVGAQPGGRELFVRTSNGGLAVCPVTLAANAAADFAAGLCPGGSTTISLGDSDGRTSQVMIDPSGLAKRLN